MTAAKPLKLTVTLSIALTVAVPALAAVSAEEAAKLKTELTPVGAEKAGNKEGTIPPWTGGFKERTPPITGRRPDPFAEDKVLYSITAENAAKYADKLSAGTLAMLKKYPTTFRLDVYMTRRTASMPQVYYDATFKNATQTKLVTEDGGRTHLENDAGGVPFPIPKDGAEVMANQVFFYLAPFQQFTASNYLIQADGRRVLVSTYTNLIARYTTQEQRVATGLYQAVRSSTSNPPIRAGEALAGVNYTDASKDTVWVYLPGQRRVRKLPTSCCDTPTPFSSGLVTFDEVGGGFFGSMHKFDWKLVGKKEMVIPYNSNRFFVPTKNDDAFSQFHLNPDHVRWELHRVWIVEAKLKAGERHTSPRSVYYIDEDWWGPTLSDRYDAQDQLARTGFGLTTLMTETGTLHNASWGWYDLISGSAYISNVYNESPSQVKLPDNIAPASMSPDALAGEGAR